MEQSFTSQTLPEDHKKNIVQMKKELRRQIGDVEALFAEVCNKIEQELEEISAVKAQGQTAWPVVDYAEIEAGTVSQNTLAQIKKRGCLVVRQNFPREQALAWDKSMIDYLDSNNFDEQYRGPGDNFFGSLEASKPEIFPIYWSPAQMNARQDPRMANVQSFMNRLWKFESGGLSWFDPDINIIYPDRIRHRRPGTTSKGLGAHTDSGALERWLLPAYQKVFRKIFTGRFSEYDPWDAAYRTEVNEYEVGNTTKCSAFRTFQGWTALSDMALNQGLLHVVPIPEAMAYVLLRPLLDDVPEDELCGVAPGRVLPISEKWHPLLVKALSSIPALEAGDSVWWHCDVIHSVAPVEDQKGWGNVMYIPAAPLCEKNVEYAKKVAQAFARGGSPADFPKEDYEAEWQNRFKPQDLNAIGKRALALNG
ncbi:DUF1479 domain-containing protein [Rouxiella badensis]|jgi:hypothetical protein|uniref:DUF1479 domain-containing protein n=1 Tax=Rouxiella badensis TaxID=1646377 RepID=A0A1X0WGT8_9GAMM|nr:DUF1479 domain-containing protein [Rouxiella badensis]MCC3701596.1 DUF1479 domain-containing protein [Rouxiella badensis]MCC3719387.1 DUF1479 domain-containing protein [Rouxiella badensis]MCC3728637.1 DUF1479 domain-containing protein [Rouxiella badensis]MCC3734330.1 DUF1479 domain-containing protein [Rouxiella badensis]MCC3739367.1 DUF1479 domain-containing protein [Rouxiella badensis]